MTIKDDTESHNSTPYNRIGFIGLGLLGGSLAHLIRSYFPTIALYAVSQHTSTINYAKNHGIIDRGGTQLNDLPKNCDLVFICTPISHIADYIHAISKHIEHPCTITDIGSVKQSITSQVPPLQDGHHYIPGHPMAGSEKTGLIHADKTLIQGARYCLVPDPSPAYLHFYLFLESLHFEVIVLNAQQHDIHAARASHFPYLMACLTVLTGGSKIDDTQHDIFQKIVSSGYRDTTRVAESDSAWGTDVCRFNKNNILSMINETHARLASLENMIKTEDWAALTTLLEQARQYRKEVFPPKAHM